MMRRGYFELAGCCVGCVSIRRAYLFCSLLLVVEGDGTVSIYAVFFIVLLIITQQLNKLSNTVKASMIKYGSE